MEQLYVAACRNAEPENADTPASCHRSYCRLRYRLWSFHAVRHNHDASPSYTVLYAAETVRFRHSGLCEIGFPPGSGGGQNCCLILQLFCPTLFASLIISNLSLTSSFE